MPERCVEGTAPAVDSALPDEQRVASDGPHFFRTSLIVPQ
jgi:hypothetical protein